MRTAIPQGLDIDIGTEIANRLGLKVQFVNSVFDTIIAAVTSGKCDIIISAQNITADRQKQVSMIPYFKAGQSFVAAKGNPKNINTADGPVRQERWRPRAARPKSITCKAPATTRARA